MAYENITNQETRDNLAREIVRWRRDRDENRYLSQQEQTNTMKSVYISWAFQRRHYIHGLRRALNIINNQ